MNELMEKVPNASITFQHQTLTDLLYTVKTASDGTVMKNDIPEGRYVFNISAPGTKPFSGSFVISPGITTTVPIGLEVTLVQVEWSVTPVALQDSYQITISQTFATNVPTPVLVVEPAGITIPELAPGQVFNGEFTASNYGLIALNNVNISFPTSFGEFDIELLATIPKTIGANQKVTVPYRITRRITTAMLRLPFEGDGGGATFARNSDLTTLTSNLFTEVMGYGGLCTGGISMTISGDSTICPGALNERTVTKSATYTASVPIPGSSCGGSGSGTPVGGTPSPATTYGYGSGVGGQSGGGSTPGGTGAISTLPGDEGCIYPKRPDKPPCKDCDACTYPGSSIDIGNGTYIFTETDLKVPAHAVPIDMSRTYRSNQIMKSADDTKWSFAAPNDGPLGFGWHSPWFAQAGDGFYLDGEGSYFTFQKDAGGNYLPHQEAGFILKKTATGYEVSKRGGDTSVFNMSGMLTSIRDRRGNAVTLNYDAAGNLANVTDAANRQVLTFIFDGSHHISSVTDIAGRTVTYSYDSHGNMTKVVLTASGAEPITLNSYAYDLTDYPTPPVYCKTRTYVEGGVTITETTCYTGQVMSQQNDYHNLIKKTNAGGESYSIRYKAEWRNKGIVESITDPSGRTTDNTYGFGSGVFYTNDYTGRKFKRVFNDQGKLLLLSELDATGAESIIRKTEYLDGRIEKTTDAMGNVTSVQKDEWDNIIKKTDAAGNTTTYTYTLDGKPLTITDPLGTVTKYEYDAYGNKTKDIIAAGTADESVTTYTYNQYNELASITKGDATTNYEYSAAGQINKIIDPRGNSTAMTYDGAGNLQARMQPLIGDTTFSDYDYKGNPAQATDPNGNTTTYTYDELGRALTVTAPGDVNPTQYAYVPVGCTSCGGGVTGKIDHIILPEGNKINYAYDAAGNTIKITDNDGNSINYSYDKYGNKTREDIKDASGTLQKTLGYQYDPLNRQTRIINPDTTYTENGYDSRGNRVSVKNPSGNTTGYEYDAINRLTKVNQPGNITTAYTYDRRNNLLSVTDADGNTTTYAYDDKGRVYQVISPDTGTTTYQYDPVGNMTSKTDAKGITISYTYDAANRLTRIHFPSDPDITYVYDNCVNGKGRLCSMTDASGSTVYEFSPKGKVTKETKTIDSIQYITQYTYDQNGNLKTMTYPSSRVITYNYTSGQIVSVQSNAANLASNIQYKPFGGVSALVHGNGIGGMSTLVYGNGIIGTIGYDNQYRISTIQASGVLNLVYDYDSNGNIIAIANALDATKNKSFTYDALDRLTSGTGSWGSLGWTYDGVGNRLTENSNSYAYAPNTNKLTSVSGISFGYDNNGNTTTEGSSRQYIYNQNQRLIQVNNGSVTSYYTYNGNGQRVKKIVNGTTMIFHYNLGGQIIAESDGAGTITAEYVYLNGNPLAKIEGTAVYYYHTDNLGTPQKITDGTGAVVWSADYKPFGEVTITMNTITNNLRFPGQYYDAESALNYNLMRDYNVIGRYIEADKIGIRRGKNHLYVYVGNNPISGIDPDGLHAIKGPYGWYYHSECKDGHYHPNGITGDPTEEDCSKKRPKDPPRWICIAIEKTMCKVTCKLLEIGDDPTCDFYSDFMCGPDNKKK